MFGICPFPLISILSYSISYFVQFQYANIANLIEYTLVIKPKSNTEHVCSGYTNLLLSDKEHSHYNRKGRLSHSKIITILIRYHLGSVGNFKHYHLFYTYQHLTGYFPDTVLITARGTHAPYVLRMMFFMKIQCFEFFLLPNLKPVFFANVCEACTKFQQEL